MIAIGTLQASSASVSPRKPLRLGAGVLIVASALGLQALLPLAHPLFGLFNLPMLVVVYLVMRQRTTLVAMLGAMLVGWTQDGLTRDPIGVLGIVYLLVAYLVSVASLYLKVSVVFVLGLFVATAYLLYEILLFAVRHALLGQGAAFDPWLWTAGTALHVGLALLAYPLLDRLAHRP